MSWVSSRDGVRRGPRRCALEARKGAPARGGATGLLAVTVAFGGAALVWGQGDGVRLHAARKPAGGAERGRAGLHGEPRRAGRARVRRLGAPPRAARAGGAGRRLRLGEHGAPGDARAKRQGGTGRPVRPQPSLRPGPRRVGVTEATLLDRMLDPGVTLGTSTPRADPPATMPGRCSGGPRRSGPAARPSSRRRRASSSGARRRRHPRRTGASTRSSSRTGRPTCS